MPHDDAHLPIPIRDIGTLGLRYLESPARWPAPSAAQTTTGDAVTLPTSVLLAALSAALDLTEGQVPGHAVRTCYLASRVAERIGLPTPAREHLYFAAFLKDAGCSSNAAALAGLFGTDDIALKARQATIERSVGAYAAFAIQNLPAAEPLPRRMRRLIHIALSGRRERRAVESTRCERGASIARKAGFGDEVGAAIMDLHEHWDGGGMPAGRRGVAIDPLARILAACAALDAFTSALGPDTATDVIRRRRGTWYEPEVVDALLSLCREGLLTSLADPELDARTWDLEPARQIRVSGDDDVDRIAAAFADVIDAKSPYTGSHSRRVSDIGQVVGERLGLEGRALVDVRRAGLLHDLGKLGVPNIILDKPGALTQDEFAVIRRHPEMTHRILAPVPTFATVADVAAAHHERLDGGGYFRGLGGASLGLEARIVAVADVFEALTADRPYRAGMPLERAMAVITSMTGDHLAVEVVGALRECLDAGEADVVVVPCGVPAGNGVQPGVAPRPAAAPAGA